MAQRQSGKASSTDRVTFTKSTAERIAKAVRTFERGDRSSSKLSFERVSVASGAVFRTGTFTGVWQIGQTAAVTLRSTGSTAAAMNLFAGVTAQTSKNCAIAKDGTAWFLIASEC
jgi:hypothetical protein